MVYPAREFGEQWGDVAITDVVSIVIHALRPESAPSHVVPGLGEAGAERADSGAPGGRERPWQPEDAHPESLPWF